MQAVRPLSDSLPLSTPSPSKPQGCSNYKPDTSDPSALNLHRLRPTSGSDEPRRFELRHALQASDRRLISVGQRATNDQLLDIARAFVDLAHTYIPIDALDRKVADVAIAAVHLNGVGADLFGHLGGKQLGH